jgi:anionic cell wall polymer biosynthesis LytR-Cps2A-Psr (LCP) family protein
MREDDAGQGRHAAPVSTVVTVLDREGWEANTDIIVLVDPSRRELLWIPRDMWCARLGDRVNGAFKRGGHVALLAALAELGLHADHSVCLARAATVHALRDVSVRVPVDRSLAFRYPLAPEEPIEHGEKVVRFDPPAETLEGERLHQWIGARLRVARAGSDLDRLARQQVLLRALLLQGFDVTPAVANPDWVSTSGESALDELRAVDPSWRLRTLPRLRPTTIEGKSVLIRRPWWWPGLRRPAKP